MTIATAVAKRGGMGRYLTWVVAAGLFLWIWPPFHIHRLQDSAQGQLESRLAPEARQIADRFWSSTLTAIGAKPSDLRSLVDLLEENPTAARRYGHTADYGGNPSYFLEGTARVTSIDDMGLWLDVGAGSTMKVVLLTGPIFGNALRDATGKLPMGELSFSQFNAISEELDRLAESQGRAGLRGRVAVGTPLHIIAAGEVDDSFGYPVLELAPIRITVQ